MIASRAPTRKLLSPSKEPGHHPAAQDAQDTNQGIDQVPGFEPVQRRYLLHRCGDQVENAPISNWIPGIQVLAATLASQQPQVIRPEIGPDSVVDALIPGNTVAAESDQNEQQQKKKSAMEAAL
jgi:hypothetical protein